MPHYDGPAFYKNSNYRNSQAVTPPRQSPNHYQSSELLSQPVEDFVPRAFHPKHVPPSLQKTAKKADSFAALAKQVIAAKKDYLLLVQADDALDLGDGSRPLEPTTSAVPTPGSESAPSAVPTPGSESAPSVVPTVRSESATSAVPTVGSETVTSAVPTSGSESATSAVPTSGSESATSAVLTVGSESVTSAVPTVGSESETSAVPTIGSESATSAVPTVGSESVTSAVPTPGSESEMDHAPTSGSETVTSAVPTSGSESAPSAVLTSGSESETSAVPTSGSESAPSAVPTVGSESAPSAVPTIGSESDPSTHYQFPPLSILPAPVDQASDELDEWVLDQSSRLDEALSSFGVDAHVANWTVGPTVTQFEITLGRGVKVSKITNLNDDLKLALAARDIRIEAPIPGKSTVGVEIPNLKSRPVMLAEVLQSPAFKEAQSPLTVALGVDLFGQPQICDLQKMPHGLIAGATGSGKSVFINSMLVSLLYKATPAELKLLLIDPKAVEMAPYHDIPHLLAPVISDPQAASAALKWVVDEMEQRYQRLAAAGARNIAAFNAKAKKAGQFGLVMPYIVIVIDELADLMMVASGDVQDYIARITQKARAAGIHLIVATQRPSVDVVTGVIKNNIPTRVAFMVASQVDSRTILDTSGAERLLGRGDMLYLGNGSGQPKRLQGTFIEDAVDDVCDFVRTQGKPQYAFDPDGLKKQVSQSNNEDELLPTVLDYIVNEEHISTSKLQRVFSIGYNRAANLIDELQARQYISPARGSKPRDVFLTQAQLDKIRQG